MDLQDVIARGQDAITVARVFGPPLEKDGVTIIPAAAVGGGGGGGGGENEGDSPGKGFGTGFGLTARPAGAFVIQNGTVRWQPAVDPNRLITLGIVALFVFRSLVRARARTRRKLGRAEA